MNLQYYLDESLAKLKKEVSSVAFKTNLKTLTPISFENNVFVLETYNNFFQKLIEDRYLPFLQNSLREVMKNECIVKITYPYNTGGQKNESEKNSRPNITGVLNPRYVFETFVVGNSNRMAHAASLAVAEAPARAYNPLFLYGGVGLGKTHLMHSIAQYILMQNNKSRVVYASSEKFTNELIESIKTNKNEEFRQKYRNVDVLLIDDIQFISEKESTQEEFFHTFNTLHEANKQIIISSDRPPKEIKTLEDRLRSRFEWGLIADIQPPDFETRVAILRRKAELEYISIPDDVLAFIAKSIVSNIRELEGALTRIVAYGTLASDGSNAITIDIAEKELKNIFEESETKNITCELIQDVVASYYNLKSDELRSKKRTKSIAYPRQVAMYLSRKMLDSSLSTIGESFGGRDHTTIMHGCDKIGNELETNPKLQQIIDELEKKILG